MKRFIVIHAGARLHYAVPALLAQAGMLDRLYTDVNVDVSPVRHFASWWPRALSPKPVRRLLARSLPTEIPRNRVRTMVWRPLLDRVRDGHPSASICRQVLRDGFGTANSLYVFSDAEFSIALSAKKAGLEVVYEQIGNPNDTRILREECQRFPGVEEFQSVEEDECDDRENQLVWKAVDRILVPSEFVRLNCIAGGAAPRKMSLVPYGIPSGWLQANPAPKRGRILFVGEVSLRKGSHYLAAATRILRKRGLTCDVRVVGRVKRGIAKSPLFRGPTYVGQVPRSEVLREFLAADIFVLPTLSDSFALAHLEALACGVPVITTPNCGSVVRHGIDGFIVPIRDENALAEKIELLLTDRRLRNEMSHNARARAREYTWERYKERLLAAITATADVNQVPQKNC